jgi:hypothetical protein
MALLPIMLLNKSVFATTDLTYDCGVPDDCDPDPEETHRPAVDRVIDKRLIAAVVILLSVRTSVMLLAVVTVVSVAMPVPETVYLVDG